MDRHGLQAIRLCAGMSPAGGQERDGGPRDGGECEAKPMARGVTAKRIVAKKVGAGGTASKVPVSSAGLLAAQSLQQL